MRYSEKSIRENTKTFLKERPKGFIKAYAPKGKLQLGIPLTLGRFKEQQIREQILNEKEYMRRKEKKIARYFLLGITVIIFFLLNLAFYYGYVITRSESEKLVMIIVAVSILIMCVILICIFNLVRAKEARYVKMIRENEMQVYACTINDKAFHEDMDLEYDYFFQICGTYIAVDLYTYMQYEVNEKVLVATFFKEGILSQIHFVKDSNHMLEIFGL